MVKGKGEEGEEKDWERDKDTRRWGKGKQSNRSKENEGRAVLRR